MRLNEAGQQGKLRYAWVEHTTSGPDHARTHAVKLQVGLHTYVGVGSSVKRARASAAELALAAESAYDHAHVLHCATTLLGNAALDMLALLDMAPAAAVQPHAVGAAVRARADVLVSLLRDAVLESY